MRDAVVVEGAKLRHAPVGWAAAVLAAVVMPLLGVAFVGLAGTGAQGPLAAKLDGMVVGSGWDALLGTVGQLVAVGQFLAVGFVAVWVFGREFQDGTVAALFALPVSRGRIATAKFAVLGAWALVVSSAVVVVVAVAGIATGLDPADAGLAAGLTKLWFLAVVTSSVALPVALAASVGRGYLAGMATLIAIVAVSQVAVLFGIGGWVPFAAPGLWAVGWQSPETLVSPLQLVVAVVAAMVGVGATAAWWNRFQLR